MKKKKLLVVLMLAGFCFSGGSSAVAQERSSIAVKSSELNSGVVILSVARGDKSFTLQCNQGAPDCTALTNGKYLMIELPKNFGMYECRDVEVYPESAGSDSAVPDKHKKVGEYCLIEK